MTRPLLRFVMDRFSQLDTTNQDEKNRDDKTGHVLIVDDAIESGQTIQHIITGHLSGQTTRVHVAVLSWSVNYADKKAEINPDSFISKRIHHYPWSQNSPHLETYHRWLRDHELEEWA